MSCIEIKSNEQLGASFKQALPRPSKFTRICGPQKCPVWKGLKSYYIQNTSVVHNWYFKYIDTVSVSCYNFLTSIFLDQDTWSASCGLEKYPVWKGLYVFAQKIILRFSTQLQLSRHFLHFFKHCFCQLNVPASILIVTHRSVTREKALTLNVACSTRQVKVYGAPIQTRACAATRSDAVWASRGTGHSCMNRDVGMFLRLNSNENVPTRERLGSACLL